MAKERNLTNITSVAAADFLRIVTSAGASVKATAANFAKYVVEKYNGSTVAGSTQTLKSALDDITGYKVEAREYKTSGASGTTDTFTLESANTYLLIIGNINSATNNTSGVYLITAHSAASNMSELKAATSGVASVSLSQLTLTVTYNKNYVLDRLVRL